MNYQRQSGILLHPTSFPGPDGIGSLDAEAFAFVDFLAEAGQSRLADPSPGSHRLWRFPLQLFFRFCRQSAADFFAAPGGGRRSRSCRSRRRQHAGRDGAFRLRFQPQDSAAAQRGRALFHPGGGGAPAGLRQISCLSGVLARGLCAVSRLAPAFRRAAVESLAGGYPAAGRGRTALLARGAHAAILVHKYAQFVFFEQWFALKEYANSRGIRILGDIPIYVSFDSADVWANPHLFYLDQAQNPTLVAGVPPDYFSETGQLWGNPMYRWERLRGAGFFLVAGALPLESGADRHGADRSLPRFRGVLGGAGERKDSDQRQLAAGSGGGTVSPTAAGDGASTDHCRGSRPDHPGGGGAARPFRAFPGMKVLHFAFGSGPDNPYLPFNIERNCVIYTGTHDNNTTIGWWKTLPAAEKEAVRAYLGSHGRDMPWDLIRLAMASVAEICIFPLQDILALDSRARMNSPGRPGGNWQWRYLPQALTPEISPPPGGNDPNLWPSAGRRNRRRSK